MAARLSPRLGIPLLMLIAVTFSLNHISARVAFDHGASVPTAVLARSAFTAIAVFALLRLQGVSLALGRTTVARAVLIGLALAVQSYCLYAAVARIPVALALLAFNTFPVILSLMAWATGRGRPGARALIAMPVALVGLAIALDVWGKPLGAGVLWAFGAALAFATVLLLTDRWLKDVDGRIRSMLTMATTAVVVALAAVATGSLVAPVDATGWLGVALLSVLYGLAITSLFVVLPKLGSATYAVVLNFEPIAALFLAWVIIGQVIAPLQIFGAFVVMGAIAWLGLARR
ncbi:MAG TPA: DMT family transporter [Burkholderiales bacterium]